MARQVQLRNNIFLLLVVLFYSCGQDGDKSIPELTEKEFISSSDSSISLVAGILQNDGKPFTGVIYTLAGPNSDTADIRSYKNGKEDGEWKKFYPSGKKKEMRFFTNGEKTGKYTAWWKNGQKQLDYNFVNGEYEGEFREWNEEGRLTKIMHYVAGHEEGAQQWWYDNGKIKANYIIKDGRRYGLLGTKNCVNVSDSIFNK